MVVGVIRHEARQVLDPCSQEWDALLLLGLIHTFQGGICEI